MLAVPVAATVVPAGVAISGMSGLRCRTCSARARSVRLRDGEGKLPELAVIGTPFPEPVEVEARVDQDREVGVAHQPSENSGSTASQQQAGAGAVVIELTPDGL
jgi:hypothetical protein